MKLTEARRLMKEINEMIDTDGYMRKYHDVEIAQYQKYWTVNVKSNTPIGCGMARAVEKLYEKLDIPAPVWVVGYIANKYVITFS